MNHLFFKFKLLGLSFFCCLLFGPNATAFVEKVTKAQKAAAQKELPVITKALKPGPMKEFLQKFPVARFADEMTPYNAVKVAKEFGDANHVPGLIHYSLPAMSVLQRLPNVYPIDGKANEVVRIISAQDEYEPGSFSIYAAQNYQNVDLRVSDLKTKDGKTFAASDLDLTVVKVWYTNGNGWYSYFADPGLKLTPELLLHDENLITVDRQNVKNFARVDYKDGAKNIWISPPRHMADNTFNFSTAPFKDAKTIQPVSFIQGEFKQFFLTAHTKTTQAPGLYKGNVELVSNGKVIYTIPVGVKVLPIKLPLPKTYFDHDRDLLVTLMGGIHMRSFLKKVGGNYEKAKMLRRSVLTNQRKHGLYHSEIEMDPADIEDMKIAGMQTNPIFGPPRLPWLAKHYGGRLTYDEIMLGKIHSKKASEFYQKHLGHNNVLMTYADEPGSNYMAMIRPVFHEYLNYDFLVGTAGHKQILHKAGYLFRNTPFGSFPDDNKWGDKYNKIGKSYIGFYAGQHNGVENPEFVRRQHGMVSYLTNCSMINNYAFGLGTWNDLSSGLYKPMNLAYGTSDGVVDTLAWEGFREGIDDIRYASVLMKMADKAANSKNLKEKLAGLKIKQYFVLLDPLTLDLNGLRMEMIQKILTLQALAKE